LAIHSSITNLHNEEKREGEVGGERDTVRE